MVSRRLPVVASCPEPPGMVIVSGVSGLGSVLASVALLGAAVPLVDVKVVIATVGVPTVVAVVTVSVGIICVFD